MVVAGGGVFIAIVAGFEDVVCEGAGGVEFGVLEDESEVVCAVPGSGVVWPVGEGLTVEGDVPGGGGEEQPEDV